VDSRALSLSNLLLYGIAIVAGYYHVKILCRDSVPQGPDRNFKKLMPTALLLFFTSGVIVLRSPSQKSGMIYEPEQVTAFNFCCWVIPYYLGL